jgi:hypothetical protein
MGQLGGALMTRLLMRAGIVGICLVAIFIGRSFAQTDYDPRFDPRLENIEHIKSGRRVTLVYNGTEEFYNHRYALDAVRYLREVHRAVEHCDKQAYDHAVRNLEALYQVIQEANARRHREWEATHPDPSSDEKWAEQTRYNHADRDADAVYQLIHTHLEPFEAKSSCPSSTEKTVGLGSWNAEVLAYGGGVSAESFGANYHPDIFGGRAAFGVALPYQMRAQFDVEGEATGSYCTPCNSRSEIAYAAHLDWRLTPQLELGAFGGLQNAHPTFNAPTDTNYFLGGEARYNGGWWLAGLQAGYFDVAHGPGTIDNAWFVEGRAKIALGQFIGSSQYFNPVLGGSIGYAEGDLSTTSLWATSTQWSVTLAQHLNGTAATVFVGFHHYTNRVETLGTVWDESVLKTGIKFDLSGTPQPAATLEPSQPLPFIAIRTGQTF